VILPKIS
jgi:hypothetical protein